MRKISPQGAKAREVDPKRLGLAMKIYDTAWRGLVPILRASSRLKEGYGQRRSEAALAPADLWIQAASGGEAYLAWSLLCTLDPRTPVRVLVTTNTRQGMDILEKAAADTAGSGLRVVPGWFPFDRPGLMQKAVGQVNPRLVVLLETEIWPGLLYALKKENRPVWIINGRISEKSLAGYSKFGRMLRVLRPHGILAVSAADAARFAELFGPDIVSEIPNIKFDRLPTAEGPKAAAAPDKILPPGARFLVLGSVRQEEERQVGKLIRHVRARCPQVITGLFPRHMHRLDYWKNALSHMGVAWQLRSRLKGVAEPGRVILWDTFGELSGAYASADAVFVGGSLARLGGQNFLEPLIYGNRPVIGPSWENFSWAGETIFRQGLVIRERNWRAAADRLVSHLQHPPRREEIRKQAIEYISARQGGTRKACRVIEEYLDRQKPAKEGA